MTRAHSCSATDRVELLEREVKMLRADLARLRTEPPEAPHGCGDHSCLVHTVTGMGTNGGCRCDGHRLRLAIQFWKRRAAFLLATIDDLTDELGRERERALAAEMARAT